MTDLDDPRISPALSREVDGTFALLTTSDRMLGEMHSFSLDLDPFFACFSTGAERLLKLVHGLATADSTGAWPSQDVMSKDLSHDITALDGLCRQHVVDGLHRAAGPGYIKELLVTAQSNTALPHLLEATTRYAKGGRFYNLDTLAEGPPDKPSPADLWELMQRQLQDARPEAYTLLGQADGYEQALTLMRDELRTALHDWWMLYVRAAMHGVFGDRAKRWLSNRTPPPGPVHA